MMCECYWFCNRALHSVLNVHASVEGSTAVVLISGEHNGLFDRMIVWRLCELVCGELIDDVLVVVMHTLVCVHMNVVVVRRNSGDDHTYCGGQGRKITGKVPFRAAIPLAHIYYGLSYTIKPGKHQLHALFLGETGTCMTSPS